MVKVDNQETLRLLTKRFMKMNRGRNIVAVLAIMLTSLLFTSLFTGAMSLILSKRATDTRQFMCSSHAIAQDMTEEQLEKSVKAAAKDKNVERFGKGIFLGGGVDTRFGFSTEVRYGDENLAESFNCVPTKGSLPKEKNEIAVSTLVLEELGVPKKIGQELTVTYEQGPDSLLKTDTFRLSGYWEGDKAVLAQLLWVSEDYAEENYIPVTEEELENGNRSGGGDCVVWYKNLWNLEKKTKQLSEKAGFTKEGKGFEVNPAYNLMEEDSFSFVSAAVLVLFVMLAGYLIIYNIFNISVKTDIRTYGLLKNVGTTGKQLKKIVRMQAWRLSVIGIPIGLVLGYAAGVLMAPSLAADAQISAKSGQTAVTVVAANPLIFLAAGLFTLGTVYLSSLQACRIVEKVSPVEALRLAETDQASKKAKRNTSVTWWGMAVQNMLRNWKKGLIVMASIALSMVVVNCIVMIVNGYDFDQYKKIFLASDFQVDQMTGTLSNTNFHGVTPEIKQLLEDCPYSKSTGYVYYSAERHEMEPRLRMVLENFADRYESYWNDFEKERWKTVQETNAVDVHYIGVNEAAFEKLEWKGRQCSWEDFKTGNYIITDYGKDTDPPESYYQIGDSVRMEYQNEKAKVYEVLGEAEVPYAIDYPYSDIFFITVIVPESEYIEYTGSDSAMYAAVDVKKGEEERVRQYIQDTIVKENDMMNVFSVLDMKESFQRYVNKYYTIGAFLVAILAAIGIMNFFNTTATSVLSRKKELALLEVVGMTKPQITKMLVAEGCIYLAGAFCLALLIICFGAEKLLSYTVGAAFFFQMHLTVLPCILMLPVLFVIVYIIPKYQFRKMAGESVVERIRND